MVFVKVRETYDLQTTKNKMTVIGIHTPKPDIIKKNYPGLLMQCKAYRPVSADVRIACASMLPLDPLGVGTDVGDVAPEDIFNPILYKAMSNKGMSQLEARINAIGVTESGLDVNGNSAAVDVDTFTNQADEFDLYYGLLSNTHDWKHASAQAGLSMTGLKPLVYEMVYNVGDMTDQVYATSGVPAFSYPAADGTSVNCGIRSILGKAKEMPFINCTSYSLESTKDPENPDRGLTGYQYPGFPGSIDPTMPSNCEVDVPWIKTFVAAIIVPPSKLHELFFRMVVEWTIEFSSIRPLSEITNFGGLALVGQATHYQNYSYAKTKEAITGTEESILKDDTCMVSANSSVKKVM